MIVLISGPCAGGKTTVSRILADSAGARSVHMHTDDFYAYIRWGYVPPWQEEAAEQNQAVICAAAACAEQYALGGYQVYVDGVVGPWFLDAWKRLGEKGLDLRYVILRPDERTTLLRAKEREKRTGLLLGEETVAAMWRAFDGLGEYEAHVLDPGGLTPEACAETLRARLAAGEYGLRGGGSIIRER